MNHLADTGQAPFENTYHIDPSRRLVQIQVRKNVSPDEAVRFYTRVFSERDYQPGFSLVVDRRGLREPPPAGTVRAVVDFLRTNAKETGACRMAIVTDEDAPRSAWRGAEMLADHYTSVELRVFDDLEAAELWASRRTSLPDDREGTLRAKHTFSYRSLQLLTTLSVVADLATRSGTHAPVFTTPMSDTLRFT